MDYEESGLKWQLKDLSDLDLKDHDELAKDVGIEGIALLTIGVMAFMAVIFGSIVFCLIKFSAEKIISWNAPQVVKKALDKIKKLDEVFFYGNDMTK